MKWVLPNGPADLAGMLPGDHMLEVDGVNVVEEAHHKVSTEDNHTDLFTRQSDTV